jgi:hypothetical protein
MFIYFKLLSDGKGIKNCRLYNFKLLKNNCQVFSIIFLIIVNFAT